MVDSTCLKREWLRAWLDGELDDAVQAHVASHVRTCGVCGRVADEISNEAVPPPANDPAEAGNKPGSAEVDSAEDAIGHDSDPHCEVTTVFCFDHARRFRAELPEARCADGRFGRFELKQRVGVGG